MLDKKKIKEKLEQERDSLLEKMRDLGKLDPETGDWEATPEELSVPESDPNDMADRFEDYEAKSAMIKVFEPKLKTVLEALKNINKASFGKCKICKKDIEKSRLEVSPAAQTCKKHLEA
jgi:RNA polymerase-binding transcription factor DksA